MLAPRHHPGTIVADRFVLERLAGAGGMGEVYRARDRATGGTVALKLLHAGDRTHVARFLREARVLARLEHPNVVRYVAHGEDPVFIAMEWLDGEDLARRLGRGRLGIAETIELARPMAHGLAAAHARNVVHRDVKPSNVFLVDGRLGAAKILDFGIAHLSQGTMAAVTATGQVVGTLGYMAPEQACGELSARVDVFSFGCVLFECLAGRSPFPGDRVMEVLAKILFADAPRVGDLREDVPAALDDLVARMMANAPDARPTISDVLAALEAIGSAEPHARARTRAPRAQEPAGELPAVTLDERSLVAVVLADEHSSDANAPTVSLDLLHARATRLEEAVAPFGGRIETHLAGKTTVVLAAQGGEAADLAGRAARVSLALRRLLPRTRLAVALSRRSPSTPEPLGDVLTHAERLLEDDGEASTLAPAPTGILATDATKPLSIDARAIDASVLSGQVADLAPPLHPADAIRLDSTVGVLLDPRFEVAGGAHRWVLWGEVPPSRGPWSAPRSAVPFAGREREARMLEALVRERFGEPPAAVVLVTGPAGAGKSRLGREVLARVLDRVRFTRAEVWSARGDASTEDTAFAMLAQLISAIAGLEPDDRPAARWQKLSARVGRRLSGEARDAVAAALGEIVNAEPPAHAVEPDREALVVRLLRAWKTLLAEELRDHPIVLVLEDLHLCDRQTAQLVFGALEGLADTPLAVLAFARPEVHETFPGLFAGAHVIRLPEITPSVARRIAAATLGNERARVADAFLASAGTNAFHVVEAIRAAAEGEPALPDTVLASAQAHLERLEPQARRVLRAASVFGETFWTSAIATLLGAEAAATLGATLGSLADAGLVARRPQSRFADEEEHRFAQPLAREAAYAMLTARDRTAAHRLAAEWLESRGERDAIALAEHFARGGEPKSAVVWYLWAAEQAFEANDLATAIDRSKRGIAAGAEGSTLGELLLLQAQAIGWTGSAPALVHAELAASSIEFLAPGTGAWCRALAQVAVARARAGDVAGLEQAAARLAAARIDASFGVSPILAVTHVAAHLHAAGLVAAASALAAHVDAVAPLAHEDDAETILAASRWLHALRALHEGDPGALADAGPSLAATFERAGQARFAALVMVSTARAFAARGAIEESAAWAQRAIDLAERIGLHPTAESARALLAIPRPHPS
jgi:hypothetical protein